MSSPMSSVDEEGACSTGGDSLKGPIGGDRLLLKIGVSGSSSGWMGSVLLGSLVHIPFLNVHLIHQSRFLFMILNLSSFIIISSGGMIIS